MARGKVVDRAMVDLVLQMKARNEKLTTEQIGAVVQCDSTTAGRIIRCGSWDEFCAWKEEKARKEREKNRKTSTVKLVYDESIAEEYRKEQMNKAEEQKEPKAGTEWTDAAEVYGIAVDAEDDRPIRPQKARNVINGVEAEDAQVTAIRFQGLGEFYFDSKYGTIDWRSEVGEEISLTPVDWAVLANRIPEILKLLGADD